MVQDLQLMVRILINKLKSKFLNFYQIKKSNIKEKNNPFAVNLYVLGYDSNKKLTSLNRAVKENLKTYLNEFRMLTDGVNMIRWVYYKHRFRF